MRLLVFLFSCNILFSFSCKTKLTPKTENKSNQAEAIFETYSTYSTYHTAMGKGRGVVFKVTVGSQPEADFKVDSFVVNSIPLTFAILRKDRQIMVESNYLKSREDELVGANGKVIPAKEINDPILTENKYYPAYLIVTQNNKKIKLIIENFQKVETPK